MHRAKPRHIGPVLRVGSWTVPPATAALFRRRWIDEDRVPADGPAILVANHVSYIDPIVVASFVWHCGRVPRFLAKRSLFAQPVLGPLLARAGQIPVSRGTREAAQSLDAAVTALDDGAVVVIYPEGTVTRDPDFWPSPGRTGAARLALLRPDVAVIPIGQWGAQDAVDVYNHRYRPIPRKQVTVAAGPPIDLRGFTAAGATTANLRAVTAEIMAAITAEVARARGVDGPTDPRIGRTGEVRDGRSMDPESVVDSG